MDNILSVWTLLDGKKENKIRTVLKIVMVWKLMQ